MDEDAYSSYAKQFRLLDLVLQYDVLCRDALKYGPNLDTLFTIPSREKIGRAKMADAKTFAADYDAIAKEMAAEIAAVAEGGNNA